MRPRFFDIQELSASCGYLWDMSGLSGWFRDSRWLYNQSFRELDMQQSIRFIMLECIVEKKAQLFHAPWGFSRWKAMPILIGFTVCIQAINIEGASGRQDMESVLCPRYILYCLRVSINMPSCFSRRGPTPMHRVGSRAMCCSWRHIRARRPTSTRGAGSGQRATGGFTWGPQDDRTAAARGRCPHQRGGWGLRHRPPRGCTWATRRSYGACSRKGPTSTRRVGSTTPPSTPAANRERAYFNPEDEAEPKC